MNSSPLFKLSPELRNLIYEHVLTEGPIALDLRARRPPLITTCRRIRRECESLFYSSNDFQLKVSKETAGDIASRLGGSALSNPNGLAVVQCIRKLQIEYHLSADENQPTCLAEDGQSNGGWVELANALARIGFAKNQVHWRAESTNFLAPSLGRNFYHYLAQSARVRMFDHLIDASWDAAVHSRDTADNSEDE